jgi:late competence protein required for DNA uptake (superfamily II DNA/RNA helicase)
MSSNSAVHCKRCGQRFRAYFYGTVFCSQECAKAGRVRFCRCETPAPGGDGDCFKCGREIEKVAA